MPERLAYAGRWVALEIYDPETLPLRKIEAVGNSAADCVEMIRARGLDPGHFEFITLNSPY